MLVVACIMGSCWVLVRKALAEDCPLLSIALSFTLSNLLLLALANLSADHGWVAALILCLTLAATWRQPSPPWRKPRFSIPTVVFIASSLLAIVVYTSLGQNLYLDDDFWIHFPLIGLLQSEGLPARHPFFFEILLNGHYGRDLLIATLARHLNESFHYVVFWQTLLLQIASFLTTLGLVYRSSESQLSAVLASAFVFFGVNVGGRGGLLDCYSNNNALAYLVTLSLLHLFYLVQQRTSAPRVVITGLALGTFALVYETSFGLLGMVLIVGMLVARRKDFAAIGFLALTVAALQGGPITKLVKNRLAPEPAAVSLSPGELAQRQVVKISFPKRELFQIQLLQGSFQRRSYVYDLLPDLGAVSRIAPLTGYRPIWSWDVLLIHWLATLAAPWTLWYLLRRRPDPVGLAFWSFGAFAFLTPAVVHFGPVFEFESFRWQFAAGFGFTAAFGLAAGLAISSRPKWLRWALIVALLIINVSPSLCVFLPRVVARERQGPNRLRDAFLPRDQKEWLLSSAERLGGISAIDLDVFETLRKTAKPGELLLVNAPYGVDADIHYVSVLSGISGLRTVGHALPWPQEGVGTPPYHRSAPTQVFWEYPSVELLDQLDVDWLFLRPGPEPALSRRDWFEQHLERVWEQWGFFLYRRNATPSRVTISGISSQPATREPGGLQGLPSSAQTAALFPFAAKPDGQLWAWGYVGRGQPANTVDLHEVVSWRNGPAAAVTPPMPGQFDLVFFEVGNDGLLREARTRVPIEVVER